MSCPNEPHNLMNEIEELKEKLEAAEKRENKLRALLREYTKRPWDPGVQAEITHAALSDVRHITPADAQFMQEMNKEALSEVKL